MGGTERGFRNSPGGDFASVPRSTAYPQENCRALARDALTPNPSPGGRGEKEGLAVLVTAVGGVYVADAEESAAGEDIAIIVLGFRVIAGGFFKS